VLVGIFGGAFNPPHIGHLVCVQEALVRLELDHAVVVPVGQAPHRPLEQDPGAAVRLELCSLATADDPRLSVSGIELERPGPSYTSDTLRELRERSPDDDLYLILGADQAATLPDWHEPEEVLSLATLAVAERKGLGRDALSPRLAGLRGAERARFFEMPRIDISSSYVRARVARGEPVRYLVRQAVAAYILEQGLYATSAPAGAGR
jgi:nicotinate-nucleotide adenylyltransferase